MEKQDILEFRNPVLTVRFDPETLLLSVESSEAASHSWRQNPDYSPWVTLGTGKEAVAVPFTTAAAIQHRLRRDGPYNGVESVYSFAEFSFKTFVWIDGTSSDLLFECIPLNDPNAAMRQIHWPPPFDMGDEPDGYAVLPTTQGQLIYNSDPTRLVRSFRVFARAQAMPWFGQVAADGGGYFCLLETPYDAIVSYSHPARGRTDLCAIWSDSLGRIDDRRTLVYRFYVACDYVLFCKEYRRILHEKNELVTLREKARTVAAIADLPGALVIHTEAVCGHNQPESSFYDKENPANNHQFTPFSAIADHLEQVAALGVAKAYVHIDGWGKRGYDNLHPDVLPPCEEAGGTAGLRDTLRRIRALGCIPALHDQYRDYYCDGETYSEENALRNADGTIPDNHFWAGGSQKYLCAQVAPHFVRRNYDRMAADGIRPDGAYLDCFASAELDECAHPDHRMTREDCARRRGEMLALIHSRGMIASSEEPSGCFMPHMDMVHHGPWYHANWQRGTGQVFGTPVPLFDLVYHDCLVTPWATGRDGFGIPPGDSNYLYGLLNGGPPFTYGYPAAEDLPRIDVMLRLNRQVAFLEMTTHRFLDPARRIQCVEYSDGTRVTVDMDRLTWRIEWPDGSAEEGIAPEK